jgi:Protein of unknown function (DUF3175)
VDVYSARMLAGLFSKDAKTIAASLSSNDSSHEGAVSGVRLINFYLNHAARGMSAARRRALEKARTLLSARLDHDFRVKERQRIGLRQRGSIIELPRPAR